MTRAKRNDRILDLWARNMSQGDIARRLKISVSMIESVLSTARTKRDPRAIKDVERKARAAAAQPKVEATTITRDFSARAPFRSIGSKRMAVSMPRLRCLEGSAQ